MVDDYLPAVVAASDLVGAIRELVCGDLPYAHTTEEITINMKAMVDHPLADSLRAAETLLASLASLDHLFMLDSTTDKEN